MKLSIIIVNYNVKYFLEQCLYSVLEAQKECDILFGENSTEVYVVDNDSQDDSCKMVKEQFPNVQLIENKKNVGFSRANNQAINISKGEFILLLNPDTLVAEDTFSKTINFMDGNENAGGLGVYMIDGTGKFLPESKRSFPSPAVSFYKIFGFSKLFPKSKKFGKYHLTYLDKDKTHEIEVLSGAFMMLRKKTLEKSGLLDEDFFMYGEDIDMSYRVIKAGYKNYYFSDTSIIHYKGESTKKGSLNYVFMFYNAMIIFAKKHFSNKKIALFSILIRLAVWLRAGLSLAKRIFKSAFLPVLDSVTFFAGFYFIKPIWEALKFNSEGYYPEEYMRFAVPSYVLIWVVSVFLSKGYRQPVDSKKLFRGILAGTFVILVIYSLLNEEFRYSRALLLIGTAWAIIFAWIIRAFFTIIKLNEFGFVKNRNKKILIVAKKDEYNKISKLVDIHNNNENKCISMINNIEEDNFSEMIFKHVSEGKYNEVIFSQKDISSKKIIATMKVLFDGKIEIKISNQYTSSIIGSNSIHTSGEVYVSDLISILKRSNVRIKRLSDISFSLLFLLLYPVLFLLAEKKFSFLKNIFSVLVGNYSWVGYAELNNINISKKLPKIKKGILAPVNYTIFDADELFRINDLYAKNYNLTDDIYTIYKSFDKIGNKIL